MDVEVAMTAWTNSVARLGYFEASLQAQAEKLTTGTRIRQKTLVCSEALSDMCNRVPCDMIAAANGCRVYYHNNPPEIGRNHNFLLSKLTADYTMFIEDDFLLLKPLDLSDDIDFLEANPDFVMVRYFIGNGATVRPMSDLGNGLYEISKRSNYPYSNTPHLRHRERFATLGGFREDAPWGAQEHAMGDKLRKSPLRIAVRRPDDYFIHAGRFASEQSRWPEGETP